MADIACERQAVCLHLAADGAIILPTEDVNDNMPASCSLLGAVFGYSLRVPGSGRTRVHPDTRGYASPLSLFPLRMQTNQRRAPRCILANPEPPFGISQVRGVPSAYKGGVFRRRGYPTYRQVAFTTHSLQILSIPFILVRSAARIR